MSDSLYATLWTAAHQAPLSTGSSRQEYWSRLPFPSPRNILIEWANYFSKKQIVTLCPCALVLYTYMMPVIGEADIIFDNLRIICRQCKDFQVAQQQRTHLPSRRYRRPGFDTWVRKIPWRRKWQPTQVFSPEKFPGQMSLVGSSPWGHKESDTTEHVCKSCTGSWQQIAVKTANREIALPFSNSFLLCSFLKLC